MEEQEKVIFLVSFLIFYHRHILVYNNKMVPVTDYLGRNF